MAKKTAGESEEAKLKKKLSTKKAGENGAAVRALRKRLKREQRRRRSLALRQKHAAGKKAAAPAK